MFTLLTMCLNVSRSIAPEKDAMETGMESGAMSLTHMAQARFGLQGLNVRNGVVSRADVTRYSL